MNQITPLFFLVAMVLALSACGFHLRGPVNISDSLNPLYVDTDELTATQKDMIMSALGSSGARLVDTPDGANRLSARFGDSRRRDLAQSSPTGVQLVQLSLQLTYRVQTDNGDMRVESRQITNTTNLELDNSNVLSHDKILKAGTKNLQQKLIRSMIYQLKN
jgi:LPS-assembly lipoprotein